MMRPSHITASQFPYYQDTTHPFYESEGGERPGQWLGHGVDALHIDSSRPVNGEDVIGLLEGRYLATQRKDHRAGFDLTFSAPKSVSVLWALEKDPEQRSKIIEAHRRAVETTIGFIEDQFTFVRKGIDGKVRHHADICALGFEHRVSRAMDPLLHTHVLVANLGVTADGHKGALDGRAFFTHQMYFGALYQAELAYHLETFANLAVVKRDNSSFDIVGVPRQLCDHFSKRTEEIRRDKEARPSRAGPGNTFAAKRSRGKKLRPIAESAMRDLWQAEAETYLIKTVAPPRHDPAQNFQRIYDHVLAEIGTYQSAFSSIDILKQAAVIAPGSGLNIASLAKHLAEAFREERGLVEVDREGGRFTTPAILAAEKQMMDDTRSLNADPAGAIPDRALREELQFHSKPRSISEELSKNKQRRSADGRPVSESLDRETLKAKAAEVLSKEQHDALRIFCGPGTRLRVLEGYAGTAKTSILRIAADLYKAEDYEVIGVALAGRAKEQLEQATGIPCQTVSSLLLQLGVTPQDDAKIESVAGDNRERPLSGIPGVHAVPEHKRQYRKLGSKTIIFLDEAGMVGTMAYAGLLRVCLEQGAHLRLIGDRRQLAEIESGGAFAHIADSSQRADLFEIKRQIDPVDRKLVKDLAEGRVGQALRSMRDRGRFFVGDDADSTMRLLISDWAKTSLFDPSENAVLASTKEEVRMLNALARERRIDSGCVNDTFALESGSVRYGENDRVIFTKGDKRLGVENGQTGTVTEVRKSRLGSGTLTILLDHNKTEIELSQHELDKLRHGYAMTAHAAQGLTFKNVFVLGNATSTSLERLYSQISRAKNVAKLYVAQDTAGRSAIDFIKRASTTEKKMLAHEERKRAKLIRTKRPAMSQEQ